MYIIGNNYRASADFRSLYVVYICDSGKRKCMISHERVFILCKNLYAVLGYFRCFAIVTIIDVWVMEGLWIMRV